MLRAETLFQENHSSSRDKESIFAVNFNDNSLPTGNILWDMTSITIKAEMITAFSHFILFSGGT
jgi:hypothetical protein